MARTFDPDERGGYGTAILSGILLVLAVAAIVIAIFALTDDDASETRTAIPATDIADDLGEYRDETVTVQGVVGSIVRRDDDAGVDAPAAQAVDPLLAFTLGGDVRVDEVLVVSSDDFPVLDETDLVNVTGTVRVFEQGRFAEAFDAPRFFGRNFFGDWDTRAAIVVQSIDPTVTELAGS